MDGAPAIVPTGYVRDGESIYLHGSRKNRALAASVDQPVCLTVTLLDGIVVARAAFHKSFNYRSVVIYGRGEVVVDAMEKARAMECFVEHVIPGRSAECRMPNDKELNATMIVRVAIEECSAKVRSGPPIDDDEDLKLPHWAGVIEVARRWGPARPDERLAAGTEVPTYIARYERPRVG
jgi:hypothetical protein